ncbi:FAD-dependent thymidylate synthase [candidate division WOR-3 bacterium]|nr:FAD-dependent thymidylate synthase [candidate division WOR-3 bacterium]
MRIILAGFNVDIEALQEYKDGKVILTPESISAAYARISRSPKSVNNLRKEARKEVEKARRSNRAIIFEMGHHSVAEHAVFNFDIIGISRRAVEELEKFRLCSYTEKSQRYVTLKGDFVIPEELKGTGLINEYSDMIKVQNDFYKTLFEKIRECNLKKFPDLAKDKRGKRLLENLAKEDARYILSMATQTQLGTTINARNLELMMRRFASHNLKEINVLGKKFCRLVKKIAPSIILFYKANDYDQKTYRELRKHMRSLEVTKIRSSEKKGITDVELVDYTPDGDDRILAALLFKVSKRSYADAIRCVRNLSKKKKVALFKKSCQHMELYDVTLREFECANLTYSLKVSAACFGQLKRHRVATITCQEYDPDIGFTIPDSVKEVGEEKRFIEIIKKTEKVYHKIEKKVGNIGSYILTNAHCKRMLLNVNLRELYHISRLREDPTAQWDIRNKAQKMSKLAKKVMPITTQLLGGKNDYREIYFKLFGKRRQATFCI